MLKTAGAPRLRLTTLLAAALFGLSFAATAAPTAEPSTGTHAKAHVKKAKAHTTKAGAHVAKNSHLTAKQVKKAKSEHRKSHKAVKHTAKHAPKARTGV